MIAGLYGRSMLNFIRNCWIVFQSDFLPVTNESSHGSTSLSAFAMISVPDFGSNKYLLVFHCCFNLHFLDDIYCEASLSYTYLQPLVYPFQVACPFFPCLILLHWVGLPVQWWKRVVEGSSLLCSWSHSWMLHKCLGLLCFLGEFTPLSHVKPPLPPNNCPCSEASSIWG